MYQWTRPRVVVPMHGEDRHVFEQIKLVKAEGFTALEGVHNGVVARLAPGPAQIIDEARRAGCCATATSLLRAEDGPLRERRKLSFSGAVSVFLVVDRDGEMAADPHIVMHGIPGRDWTAQLRRDRRKRDLWRV